MNKILLITVFAMSGYASTIDFYVDEELLTEEEVLHFNLIMYEAVSSAISSFEGASWNVKENKNDSSINSRLVISADFSGAIDENYKINNFIDSYRLHVQKRVLIFGLKLEERAAIAREQISNELLNTRTERFKVFTDLLLYPRERFRRRNVQFDLDQFRIRGHRPKGSGAKDKRSQRGQTQKIKIE